MQKRNVTCKSNYGSYISFFGIDPLEFIKNKRVLNQHKEFYEMAFEFKEELRKIIKTYKEYVFKI